MSVVTDIVIITSKDESESIGYLNEWCLEHDTERKQQFVKLNTDAAGGTKFFACHIWAMAGNYFPYKDLINVFHLFRWDEPISVVLIINHEDENFPLVVIPAR
jgi:hypothetical protein